MVLAEPRPVVAAPVEPLHEIEIASSAKVGLTPGLWNGAKKMPKRIRDITIPPRDDECRASWCAGRAGAAIARSPGFVPWTRTYQDAGRG